MKNAFGGNIVERFGIAGRASTICLRHIVRRWFGWRVRQGDRAEQVSARAGPQVVRRAPDFLSPIDRFASLIEKRPHLDDHCGRFRLVNELLFAAPTHADGLSGPLHGDDGGIRCGIIGAVVSVTAGALHVMNADRCGFKLERFGQSGAERIDALAVSPDRKPVVVKQRNPAGRGN